MTTLILTAKDKSALIHSIEMSIDMLNDMGLDPMWMTPTSLRELATKSDEEIRKQFSINAEETFKNMEELAALQNLLESLVNN